jgi:DNA polymerase-3 subunit beta
MQVEKTLLKKALGALVKVVPSQHHNPLLTYIRLETKGDTLSLSGSDGVVDLEVSLPVEAQEERVFLVPGEVLFGLADNTPDGVVELEVGENHLLSWRAGGFKAEVRVASAEGYPELLFPDAGQEVFLPRKGFAKAVARIRHAIGRGSALDAFRGILMEFGEAGVRVVAADGYRLALYDLPEPAPFEGKALVLGENLLKALQALEITDGEEVVLRSLDRLLGLEAEGEALSVRAALRLMGGTFPSYGHVFPREFVGEFVVDTKEFREALRRLEVLADEDNHRLDFVLRKGLLEKEGSLHIFAKGDGKEGEEEIPAEVRGELEFSVNARYLLEALPEEEKTLIRLSGKTTPMVVAPAGGGGYQAVIVPLKVES